MIKKNVIDVGLDCSLTNHLPSQTQQFHSTMDQFITSLKNIIYSGNLINSSGS